MYGTRTPYRSMKGLAFRETNTAEEIRANIVAALERVRSYAMWGGNAHEVLAALKYIEQECPKVITITNDIRLNYFDDDKFPGVDAGRLRRMKLQLCSDLFKRTGQFGSGFMGDDE